MPFTKALEHTHVVLYTAGTQYIPSCAIHISQQCSAQALTLQWCLLVAQCDGVRC